MPHKLEVADGDDAPLEVRHPVHGVRLVANCPGTRSVVGGSEGSQEDLQGFGLFENRRYVIENYDRLRVLLDQVEEADGRDETI